MALVSMGSWYGDIGSGLLKAGKLVTGVTLVETLAGGAAAVIGAAGGVAAGLLDSAGHILRPPPPPPPPGGSLADSLGASALSIPGGEPGGPSNLPIILGGLAAAGLVLAAVLMRKRKKRGRR